MKALVLTTLIAAAVLQSSNIATAQQCPMMGQGQGMMGQGMMGQGMMGQGMMGRGMGMRVMMVLMDTNGDGALSLEEVQTVHAKIFKAVDADMNGKVTLEEMRTFFQGGAPVTSMPQQ